jgi:hypothetical protein
MHRTQSKKTEGTPRDQLVHDRSITTEDANSFLPCRRTVTSGKRTGGRRLVLQDCIRRAAVAMRQSRSSDLFILARAALEAAIRSDLWSLSVVGLFITGSVQIAKLRWPQH